MEDFLLESIDDITDFDDIIEEAKKKSTQKHRMLNGRQVNFYSQKCLDDLQKRIDDAAHFRNSSTSRTDSRLHYNGLLNVLRRKFREVQKYLAAQESTMGPVVPVQSKKRRPITSEQRILRLSGLV